MCIFGGCASLSTLRVLSDYVARTSRLIRPTSGWQKFDGVSYRYGIYIVCFEFEQFDTTNQPRFKRWAVEFAGEDFHIRDITIRGNGNLQYNFSLQPGRFPTLALVQCIEAAFMFIKYDGGVFFRAPIAGALRV